MILAEERADDQLPRSLAVSRAQFGRACKLHNGLSQRLRIFDSPTSRPVWSSITISRQPGTSVAIIGARSQAAASIKLPGRPSRCDGRIQAKMTPLPQRSDILDMSEPGDARAFRPFVDFLQRDGGWIGGVRIAGNQQVGLKALSAHNVVCGHQRADAFIRQQTSREAIGDRPVGFGQRLQRIGVDARSGNQNDAVLLDAEIDQCRAIVRVLNQHNVARPIQERGQQPFQDRSEQAGPPRRRG